MNVFPNDVAETDKHVDEHVSSYNLQIITH